MPTYLARFAVETDVTRGVRNVTKEAANEPYARPVDGRANRNHR